MSSRKSFMIKDILQNSNPISRDSEESNSQQDCHSCYNGDTVTYSGGLLSLTCGQSTVYQQTASLWPSFAAAAASCISCIKPLNDPSIWTTGSPDVYGTYEIGELSEQDNQQINGINSTSSGTVNSTISSSRRVRRNRTVFTELQLMGLERRFDSQKYLSTPDRAELARALGLTQLQVKTWYQNRRMKWKKQVMQGGCSTPPTKPKGRPKKNSIPSLGMNFDPAMLCSANPGGILPITNKSSGSTTNIQSVIQTTSSLTGNFPR